MRGWGADRLRDRAIERYISFALLSWQSTHDDVDIVRIAREEFLSLLYLICQLRECG